jgi:putative ABC transport system permease protein
MTEKQTPVRRTLRVRKGVRDETREEIRLHIEHRVEQLISRGHSAESARAEAERQFGRIEDVHRGARERERKMQLRGWFDSFKLDLKLGGRMLVKYPGLTIVGSLAMAFAIWTGTIFVEILGQFLYPTLPLPDGDRLVQVENWDAERNSSDPRALHDFLEWKSELTSVTGLTAWRGSTRNLIPTGGQGRPVEVAEVTASAFRVSSAEPLIGRVLTEADEQAGAPPVALIGYEVWKTRLGSDPAILGKTVQLGVEPVTVVGVMKDGYEFPIAHDVWTPLRITGLDQSPRAGPAINVFGLLAPGETRESAQVELAAIGERTAAALPATHAHLQPRVSAYTNVLFDPSGTDPVFYLMYMFPVLLLVLVCGNVALLLFARAASRESDLLVRSALGGGRSRIVAQIFAEALVLGGISAVLGVVAAHFALTTWGVDFLEANYGRLPFWVDLAVSPSTLLAAVALTVAGAAIAGILPALKVTRGMATRLRESAAGGGGLQFGGVWTAVIVAQVAVTVAFPALVFAVNWTLRYTQTFEPGFADEQFLAATLQMDPVADVGADPRAAQAARRASLGAAVEELRRRLETDPQVAGFTYVDDLPRTWHAYRFIELDTDVSGGGSPASVSTKDGEPPLRLVATASVDPSYFDVLEAPILGGRGFTSSDLDGTSHALVADQSFVDQVMQGRDAVGQRLRFVTEVEGAEPEKSDWFEVVGVVKELGMGNPSAKGRAAGLYRPATAASFDPVRILVHVRGDPLVFAQDLRERAAAVSPSLRIDEVQRADQVQDANIWVTRLWLRLTIVLSGVALLLSLAGIFAVLSFAVSRRTREIGVRVALGASREKLLVSIFRRPLIQVAMGIVAGTGIIVGFRMLLENSEFAGTEHLAGGPSLTEVTVLLGYAVLMLGVCLTACVVPTRRALAVEPTIALRAD